MKLKRFKNNPIIAPWGDDWEACATFNPAAIYKDGKIHLLYRAVGDYLKYAANLGYAIFDENLNLIKRFDEPILEPEEDYERVGDVPNVVFPEGNFIIGDELVVIYGAADKVCCAAKIKLDKFIDYMFKNCKVE